MTIEEFLEARLAEDEADARSADEGRLLAWSKNDHMVIVDSGFMQTFTPTRVLREVAAKRAIIEHAADANGLDVQVDGEWGVGARDELSDPYVGDLILRALAAPYVDHPDYDPSWAL